MSINYRKFFRQPEIISSVLVGKNAHPTSTCGAFGGLENHPTLVFNHAI
ncbi:MAG: hypothetical protein IKX14_03430 [Neisseriaceae bacterium]|nr:hypothetical protein [Neisseriaceae bacterium]